MEFSAEMITSFLEGEIVGDKNTVVNNVAKIEEAGKGDLAFLANPKYEHYVYTTEASIVIVNKTFQPSHEYKATLIKVEDAYSCFARLLDLYVANKPQKTGISSQAFISDSALIPEDAYVGAYTVIEDKAAVGKNAKIYPQVYIGVNVKIGDNVTIYPGVRVYENCVIGNNVILHSGCVIGADGFGFAPVDGAYKKIPQIGNVVLEDNVEIGANTCVDRATMGSTYIRKGVKLDNLIQIGHNVVVGENTVAAAQVGIAGSAKIGKHCMFAGQVGIAGHISIADGCQIGSQAGVGSTVKESGSVLLGTPAFHARDFQRASVVYKSLPEMRHKISQMEKELNALKAMLDK